MRWIKWITLVSVLCAVALWVSVGAVIEDPNTIPQLEKNFHQNLVRSFEDSGMKTQLDGVSVSVWSPEIRWDSLSISRENAPAPPISLAYVFQSIELSRCKLQFQLKWIRLKMNLQCESIALQHRPLNWTPAKEINSSFAKQVFFDSSEFRTFRNKQRWLDVTVRSNSFQSNEEQMQPLHINYHFVSAKQLRISFPDENLEMQWYVEPEQLRISHSDQAGHNYAFLSSELYHIFRKVQMF